MYENEDVIYADGEHQEWNDFNNDESSGNREIAEETNT